MTFEELFEKVIQDIPIKSEENVYGITFFASPGAGKSTIAKLLSEKLGVYITANDKIRRISEQFGIDVNENRKMIEQIANDRTVYMLKNKTSMIIDANMQFFWQSALDNFNSYGAKLYFIKVECDEETIINRIQQRALNFNTNKENFSRALVEDYYKYKEKSLTTPIPEEKVFFTINTGGSMDDIEKQVDELVSKLKEIR